MEDKYEGLSDEELKEIFEDMQADYWIDYYQSIYEPISEMLRYGF